MAIIKLKGTKPPTIVIKVGKFQPASYQIRLMLKGKPRNVISSSSEVDLGTVAGVSKAADLKGAELEWDVRVVRATMSPGELYSVRVRIKQSDETVEDGFFQDQGAFGEKNAHVYFDLVTFA